MSGRTPGIDAGSDLPDAGEPPPWVVEALGADVRSATRARWGFRHETWLVDRGGERLVVQRRVDGSDPTLPPHPAIRRMVRDAGLPVPEPVRVRWPGDDVVVVLPKVDGTVGAELLRDGRGAAIVGRACGWVAARLASIDPGTMGLRSRPGADDLTGELAASAGVAGFDGLPGTLREPTARYLRQARPLLDATPLVVAHGDLAPVNILVRDDRVVAVLDLDRARLAHRDYDAAWFAWVVSTHHPELASEAWRGYADAAGQSGRPGLSIPDVAWLWRLQLLERVREAATDHERDRWLAHLEAALEG